MNPWKYRRFVSKTKKVVEDCAEKGNAMALYIKGLSIHSQEFKNYIHVLIQENEERNDN